MYHILSCFEKRTISACNFNLLSESTPHPDRVMPETHDLLYILEGGWTLFQDGEAYALERDDAVFLHAGHHHFGVEGCRPQTRVMFLHVSRAPGDCTAAARTGAADWDDAVIIPSVLHCQHSETVKKQIKTIIYHHYSDEEHKALRAAVLLSGLLFELGAVSWNADPAQAADEVVDEILYRFRMSPQAYYSVQQLAGEFYLSPSTLSARFKKATGTTIHRYQTDAKLSMARALLLSEETIPLKKVAALYGFCDEYHFSRQFKSKYGVSPSLLRDRNDYSETLHPTPSAAKPASLSTCW